MPGEAVGAGNLASRFNSEITELRGAHDVLELCVAKLCQFDFVNTVTALHRVAKFGGRTFLSDPRLASVITKVRLVLDDETALKRPRHIANTAWAIAKL